MTTSHSTKYENALCGMVQVIITVIQCIICLGCLLFAIHSEYNIRFGRRKKFGMRRTFKVIPICTILGLFSFFIASISMGMNVWTSNNHQNSFEIEISAIIDTFCWSFGQFCCYLVFFLRLIDTFVDSAYPVSIITICYLVTLLILYETAWIIKSCLPILFSFKAWTTTYAETAETINIAVLILDVMITVSMIHLFVSRLLLVMRKAARIVSNEDLQMDVLHQSLREDGQNRRLMNLSVKITVLSFVSLLSSLMVVSMATAAEISLDLSGPIALIDSLWTQIDTMISSLCLVLFLKPAEGTYTILCCCCASVGRKCMNRALLRRRMESSVWQSKTITAFGIPNGASYAVNIHVEPSGNSRTVNVRTSNGNGM